MTTPIIAKATLDAIAKAIEEDQGDKFRSFLEKLIPEAADVFAQNEKPFRRHLGASLIGGECPRELWYSFRWFKRHKFDARILRLFNRGHLEEPRMVAMLLTIGCQVWQYDDDGNQYRIIGHNGHYGGSLDAVVLGIPDWPDTPLLGEFKTHNDKSFQNMVRDGVRESKFKHFVQMQQYMGATGLAGGIYMAVNKNDDDLYAEIIPFDSTVYARFHHRAGAIIAERLPPPRIGDSPGWYLCRFCTYNSICYDSETPERNCRTCRWSEPVEGGRWRCNNPQSKYGRLSEKRQLKGCGKYEPIEQ